LPRLTGRTCGPGWCGSPAVILECRALLETYHDLRAEHTAWVQRIHAVFFRQGAPALGEAALRTGRDLQAVRASAAAYLSPAGPLQVAAVLEMTGALEARREVVRHELLDAARHLTGRRSWRRGCTGSARSPRWR
jgi:transposase